MGLFDHFPYTNFHELNLMWILQALKEIQTTTEQFVAINSLKYADPIQWNITSQYEKNTIVIDPQTGTAYISVQPVPSGVALTNTDYWTVVFDLGSFVVRAAKNFTDKYEDETTLTATFPSSVNDWLIWGDTLYRVISPIVAGDQYVEGSNIAHFTAEDVIGHIQALNTTDKSNLVAAINEVLQTLTDTAGDLDDLNTTDKSNLVAAINEVLQTLKDTAGDLDDLNTTDKSNLVAAINELVAKKANITDVIEVLNMRELGCIADGTTDNSTIIDALINDAPINSTLYFPKGVYYISSPINVNKTLRIIGDGGNGYDAATIFKCGGDGIYINASGCELENFKVLADSHASVGVGIYQSWTHLSFITVDDAPTSKYFDASFDCGNVAKGFWNETIENCAVNTYHDDGLNKQSKMLGSGFKFIGAVNSLISNCWVNLKNYAIYCPPTPTAGGHYTDGLTFDNLNILTSNYGMYLNNVRSLYFSNTIIDQCNYGGYISKATIAHFSNIHIGQNADNIGNILLQIDQSSKLVIDNADLHSQGAATGISIADSYDIEINETYLSNMTYGINVNATCGNITGANIYCNSVDYGVIAFSLTFIKNVMYATNNYSQLAFNNSHMETISGSIPDLGTLNYYAPTITTQYGKKPDNIIFTITKNDSLVPIDVVYRKSGTGLTGPSVLLFNSLGNAFNNESIEFECTCMYN